MLNWVVLFRGCGIINRSNAEGDRQVRAGIEDR